MSGNFFNLLKLIELCKRQTVFNYQINHDHIGDIFAIKNNKNNDTEKNIYYDLNKTAFIHTIIATDIYI
jgi:hypothetical protein